MHTRTVGWILLAVVLVSMTWLLLRPEDTPPAESAGETANPPEKPVAPPPSKPTDTALSQEDRRALRQLRAQLEAITKPPEPPGDNPLLQLPEHLQNAPEEDQRAYLVKLAHHARGMLDLTRERVLELEEQAKNDPALEEDIERTHEAIQEGERALQGLTNHLGLPSDAG